MSKQVSPPELVIGKPQPRVLLTRWLYEELRRAILEGRLRPGSRLPATRDLARQYKVSRGTVLTAFEQLQAEGYLVARIGGGTWVNGRLPASLLGQTRREIRVPKIPAVVRGLPFSRPARPFRPYEPALKEFPIDVWTRIAGRRLRRCSTALLAIGEVAGYRPLREAIAGYLGASRGVNCSPEQIVIVAGAQQGFDILARTLLKPGDAVWLEDPGYFGATTAFRNAGAKIIPVPVDDQGLAVAVGKKLCKKAKAACLTPAHQCPLAVTMPLERRLEILAWARENGAYLIEDDYDSEYRFAGSPVPALQSLDTDGSVVLLGSFSKVLFPGLRIGYVVLPPKLIEVFLHLRAGADLFPSTINQAVLCDFMVEGHFGRHIRRMRELYAARLSALQEAARKYLLGLVELPGIQAGLSTASFLRNGITSHEAEARAAARGIEVVAMNRFCLRRTDVQGIQLGFAAFDEKEIWSAVPVLASALEKTQNLSPQRTGRNTAGLRIESRMK